MWFNTQVSSQGMLLGLISTSTYHQVLLKVPGMLLATKKINLYLCLIYVEYIDTNFLQYLLFPTVSHEPI